MINLSTFCSDMRNRCGIDLEVSRLPASQSELSFRISGLPQMYSFSFRLNRAWRSSQIAFKPDTFSQGVISRMVRKIVENRDDVLTLVFAAESILSSFVVRVDGREIHNIDATYDYSSSELRVTAEVLSGESVPTVDFLSDSESLLIETVIEFVFSLIADKESNYVAADEVNGFPEGAVETVSVNRYERDGRNRTMAIKHHGLSCVVCNFNFGEAYGPLGTGYIVVHHVVPVSQLGSDYVIDPQADLVCLCANCHAMVHRKNPPLSVSELREVMSSGSTTIS